MMACLMMPCLMMAALAPFILRPVATTLLMIALLLAGFIAWKQLPLSALPQVDYPTIQVRTLYPGASPDVMALTVTSPLERQFGQMPGLTRMTSNSSAGASVITCSSRWGCNWMWPSRKCRPRSTPPTACCLPTCPRRRLCQGQPGRRAGISIGITSKTRPLGEVQGIVERQFSNKIAQVSGVGLVSLSGGQRPAVRIVANVPALAAHGLSLETIRSAISNANANMAKGSFDGPTKAGRSTPTTSSAAQDYAKLVVAWSNGAPCACPTWRAWTAGVENVRTASWMNHQSAVIIDVQRQPGANVIATVDAIKAALPALRRSCPPTSR
jgi:multidrug efflux pump